uniref:Calmodulin n=1 Tax=Eucampia antarctica TaxID=49252 RepID=A0A7S2S136_9STRA|mmetsp:Transcript_29521/g.28392  ORF Transcript_29521/g.28392 Transcript_29521/m.28392 type:complete len:209 (+) Transcript_29521:70-696(+)
MFQVWKLVGILLSLSFSSHIVSGQFGVKKSDSNSDVLSRGGGDDDVNLKEMQDVFDDPEMAEAMQMFTDMSPDEMRKTMEVMLGNLDDDPETQKALETAMDELSKMNAEEIEQAFSEILEEEQRANDISDTINLLAQLEQSSWDEIMSAKDLILDAVIESGQMSQDDIDTYKNDPSAWEKELQFLWKELKNEATAVESEESVYHEVNM